MSSLASDVVRRICEAGRRLDRLGFCPSIAGNLSERVSDGMIAITRSGAQKGALAEADILLVDRSGATARRDAKPSAETVLHLQIYRRFGHVGAVVHGHSIAATVVSRARAQGEIVFEGYELQKAFEGVGTHETRSRLAVFGNDQDMDRLAALIEPELDRCEMGYVLRGHGLYAWGRTMDDAMSKYEAAEFLIQCRLIEDRPAAGAFAAAGSAAAAARSDGAA